MNRRGLGGTAPLDYGSGETLADPARLDEKALLQPLHWRAPRKVFVASMTDLFGTWVPDAWLDRIYDVMNRCPQHTFIVLTKRPTRMRDYLTGFFERIVATSKANHAADLMAIRDSFIDAKGFDIIARRMFGHVWVGTTIESDRFAWRADRLRQTPAAVRWVSAEPLLSGLPSLDLTGIDWLVTGGESGHKARPTSPDWVRDLRDRCAESGTAFFHKQWGEWAPTEIKPGGDLGGDLRRGHTVHLHAPGNPEGFFRKGDAYVSRVGRKAAGRLLDGREHSEFPTVAVGAGV
jgi:protein gp37